MEKKQIEEKKEYLKGYERAVRRLRRSEERIRELRMNEFGTALAMDGMPHAHNNSDLSCYAAALDDEERRYLKNRYLLVKKCKEITDRIERLENEDQKDVLFYRYIRLMKWEDIAVKMGCSWAHSHRIHSIALENFMLTKNETK